jgi:hypothetical protein
MQNLAPTSRRFIESVWRRMVLIRLAESIGLACVVASVAGLVLMPILWMRDQSGAPAALTLLALGIAFGIIWGISSRPTRLEAAIEADRQLGLDDLLGTVLLMQQRATSPAWLQSLGAMADQRCQGISASAVVAGRLGLRGWGGVGVAASLLMTLSLLTSGPANVQAASSGTGGNHIASNQPAARQADPSRFNSIANGNVQARPASSSPLNELLNRGFADETPAPAGDLAQPHARGDGQTNHNMASGAAGDRNSSSSSAGSGLSVTSQSARSARNLAQTFSQSSQSNAGEPGAGSGLADANSSSSAKVNAVANAISDDTGQGVVRSASGTSARDNAGQPWDSQHLPIDQSGADPNLPLGHIPDRDADLVREYFQR